MKAEDAKDGIACLKKSRMNRKRGIGNGYSMTIIPNLEIGIVQSADVLSPSALKQRKGAVSRCINTVLNAAQRWR